MNGKTRWKRIWFGILICRFIKCSNQSFNSWTEFNIIRDALQLESVIIVFDQVIYVKATEILRKNSVLYKNIIIRMGVFHTITMLLAIIGISFGAAGLEDIAIESNVVEEESVGRLLNGKHYNRGVRFHKLSYEVCMKLMWEGFVTWISESNEQKSVLEGLESQF